MNWTSAKLIGAGFLLGTAGVKLLSSEDAKSVYTHVTAAVMRCGSECARVYETIRENCGDISSDAKIINEKRKQEKIDREIADAKAVLAEYEEEKAA